MRERLRPGDVEVVELAWPEPEVTHDLPQIPGETYAQRLASLRALMDREGLSHVLVYGDREHFANTRWLTGYDPRFEESLVIVGLTGRPRLLVGLEGQYYAAIAQGVDVELYDEFSLQGQPGSGRTLPEILADCGLSVGSRVGLAGTKYRQTLPLRRQDWPLTFPTTSWLSWPRLWAGRISGMSPAGSQTQAPA